MALDTVTAKTKIMAEGEQSPATWWLWRHPATGSGVRYFSPIVLRILAVNVMALAILVGSLLYLGRYQDHIVATELDALLMQSRIIGSAVAEGAIVIGEDDRNILSPLLSRLMVRRLAETTETRTRLYDTDGTLLADSRVLLNNKSKKMPEVLEPTEPFMSWAGRLMGAFFDVIDFIHKHQEYPSYQDQDIQNGNQYDVVRHAIQGDMNTQVWRSAKGDLTLAAAVPVQHSKHVLGVVMLSRSDANIRQAIYTVRIEILRIFGITLMITIMLSLYLARAIARPIRLLALAAEGLRYGQTQIVGLVGIANLLNRESIPDLTYRQDEIGDLSGALRDLTGALAHRMSAIENFAADVAHEIKNPLTSLRSAVETAERVKDPEVLHRLMLIMRDDVDRLDRLITDIANASRLDAELSRAESEPVNIGAMLEALLDLYHESDNGAKKHARVVLDPVHERLMVNGAQARLLQVLQNLIGNALSFSPIDEEIRLSAIRIERYVQITIEDRGRGIPDNKLEAIFDRFYTERPKDEKFGTHSGLGLSISKMIIEAHRGKIWAENIKNAAGANIGARFIIQLPILVDQLS